jgi:hypothetical protein
MHDEAYMLVPFRYLKGSDQRAVDRIDDRHLFRLGVSPTDLDH